MGINTEIRQEMIEFFNNQEISALKDENRLLKASLVHVRGFRSDV